MPAEVLNGAHIYVERLKTVPAKVNTQFRRLVNSAKESKIEQSWGREGFSCICSFKKIHFKTSHQKLWWKKCLNQLNLGDYTWVLYNVLIEIFLKIFSFNN